MGVYIDPSGRQRSMSTFLRPFHNQNQIAVNTQQQPDLGKPSSSMPSTSPPKPQTRNQTNIPISEFIPSNCQNSKWVLQNRHGHAFKPQFCKVGSFKFYHRKEYIRRRKPKKKKEKRVGKEARVEAVVGVVRCGGCIRIRVLKWEADEERANLSFYYRS